MLISPFHHCVPSHVNHHICYVEVTGSFVKACNVKGSWLFVYSGTPMAKAGNIQKLKAFFGETVGNLLSKRSSYVFLPYFIKCRLTRYLYL